MKSVRQTETEFSGTGVGKDFLKI